MVKKETMVTLTKRVEVLKLLMWVLIGFVSAIIIFGGIIFFKSNVKMLDQSPSFSMSYVVAEKDLTETIDGYEEQGYEVNYELADGESELYWVHVQG